MLNRANAIFLIILLLTLNIILQGSCAKYKKNVICILALAWPSTKYFLIKKNI